MSSQRGNVNKKGPPKHANKWAFKNNMNDKSKKTKEINNVVAEGTCEQCKAIIEWKIKYKKYKPLTTPSKCVKCGEKNVKRAYYIVCEDCCLKHGVCGKCVKVAEVVIQYCERQSNGDTNQILLEKMKLLPERERRTFRRKLEKNEIDINQLLEDINLKLKSKDLLGDDDDIGGGDDDDDSFSEDCDSI